MGKPEVCFVSQNIYHLLIQDARLMKMGGAELQQLLMAKELARRGYKISMITQKNGREKIGENVPFRVIYTFNASEGIPGIRFFYPRLFKIWKALRNSDADIYYVRGGGFIVAVVVAYAKLNHKKVVFCGADDTDFDPEKVQLPIYRDKILYFWGMKRCDEIVVQNETQQKLLWENYKREGRLIHNGFYKTNQNSVEKREILWVAKIRKKKNPQLFVELAKKFPHEKFVMIGGRASRNSFNQPDLYEHVSEEAEEIPNLEFKGFLPFEETDKQFTSAKLFINTSAHEGFPNTFLQAWSRGIPVISFVDPDDLINKNQLGGVVNNFEEMIQTLQEVLNKRLQFSPAHIKAFFEKNLTIEKAVDKYENLFHHLVNGQLTGKL